MRRATLLPEMQRRNKTGALVDRRINEDDPGMTAEEKAVQRYAREKSRKKGASLFDLDASDDEGDFTLTHGRRPMNELPEIAGTTLGRRVLAAVTAATSN